MNLCQDKSSVTKLPLCAPQKFTYLPPARWCAVLGLIIIIHLGSFLGWSTRDGVKRMSVSQWLAESLELDPCSLLTYPSLLEQSWIYCGNWWWSCLRVNLLAGLHLPVRLNRIKTPWFGTFASREYFVPFLCWSQQQLQQQQNPRSATPWSPSLAPFYTKFIYTQHLQVSIALLYPLHRNKPEKVNKTK